LEEKRDMPYQRFETPKPVSIGDEVDVTIESVGGQGDGIAKVNGFVVFVKGTSKGDRVKIKITDLKRTYAVGEKIGEAAPEPEAAPEAEAEPAEEAAEETAAPEEEKKEEEAEEEPAAEAPAEEHEEEKKEEEAPAE
jgi:predicted RNA-binding protein with TRAM domain